MRFLVDPATVRIPALGWVFLFVVGVLLPMAAVRQHRRLVATRQTPPRSVIYASAMTTHLIFVALVWAVARDLRLDLLPPYRLTLWHAAVGVVALALGLLPLTKRFRLEDPTARSRVRLIAPRTTGEFGAFYLLSLTAGIAEQLTYRGLLFTLLASLSGSWWIAACAAAVLFGVVHLFQGWKSAAIAGVIGFRDQLVVGLTGTLFVPMVVHVLHDAITGTVVGTRARIEERAAERAAAERAVEGGVTAGGAPPTTPAPATGVLDIR